MDSRGRTILVVEDDERSLATVRTALLRAGFGVESARRASEVRDRVARNAPDVVLLQVGMPLAEGVELCRWIRARSSAMVIVAADWGGVEGAVAALDAGADDYLPQANRLGELVARVRAVIRRSRPSMLGKASRWEPVRVGDVVVDSAAHQVWVRGTVVALPLREFQLLATLAGSAGRVLTREELTSRVWGSAPISGTKSLDVHIQRLRRRIEVDPARPERIRTVRGVGYVLSAQTANPSMTVDPDEAQGLDLH